MTVDMIWHRLRGHRVRRLSGIERGVVELVARCSCGETWMRQCVDPLNNRWRWV